MYVPVCLQGNSTFDNTTHLSPTHTSTRTKIVERVAGKTYPPVKKQHQILPVFGGSRFPISKIGGGERKLFVPIKTRKNRQIRSNFE